MNTIIKLIEPHKETNEKEVEVKDSYSLPKLIEVYRGRKSGLEAACWSDDDYNWTALDICKIFPSGDKDHLVDAVAVNMDAHVVHDFIRQRKLTDQNIERLKRLYKVSVYLLSLILYFQLSGKGDLEEKEDLIAFLMMGVGKVILQIVINDEIIKEMDKEDY